MGEPKGKLVTPVADNPDDELRSLEVDALDNLKTVDQSGGLKTTDLNIDAAKDLQVDVKTVPTTVVIPHVDEKLFGFESVIIKEKTADATTTSLTIDSDAVPTGKIWKITYISALNYDGDIATGLVFLINHDALPYRLSWKVGATARYQSVEKSLELFLDAEDYITVVFQGVASPETCYLYIFGYEMNAP